MNISHSARGPPEVAARGRICRHAASEAAIAAVDGLLLLQLHVRIVEEGEADHRAHAQQGEEEVGQLGHG